VNESLFELGSFQLSSGGTSSFRINAHKLTTDDWEALAHMALSILPTFREVVGVPTGGEAFAEALLPHTSYGPVLVVDDVLTTGNSIRKVANDYKDSILLVAFSRMSPHPGIHAVFTLAQSPEQ